MSGRCRSSLTAALAVACLAAAASFASAARLSVSATRFSAAFPAWRVAARLRELPLIEATCAVTLNGTFHAATFAKVSGALLAPVVPGSILASCSGAAATLLTETLPWHLRYGSFSGTLPNMSAIAFELVGLRYLWREPALGLRCLYGGTTSAPVHVIATLERGAIAGLRIDEAQPVPFGGGSEFCPATATFSGAGTMTVQSSATRITVSLI